MAASPHMLTAWAETRERTVTAPGNEGRWPSSGRAYRRTRLDPPPTHRTDGAIEAPRGDFPAWIGADSNGCAGYVWAGGWPPTLASWRRRRSPAWFRPTQSACVGTPPSPPRWPDHLFFSSPTSSSREKVLLYLLVTMLPFAVVAPCARSALDYRRSGRRVLVVTSMMGRAVLALLMARWISDAAPGGLLVYPLAFRHPRAAKGYSVAKSVLVPALVDDTTELVRANSRLAVGERDRDDRGWRASLRVATGLRTGVVVALRVRVVRDRRDPGAEDPPGPDSANGTASRTGA